MEIIIDPKSGFCFGVKKAIELAEVEVQKEKQLYCLGQIVHNAAEVGRLEQLGIKFIDRETFFTLTDCKVMFRAHGEPPETYTYAQQNNIEIIDATCPVVLKLQDRVRNAQAIHANTQVVIYGKPDHPEVVGLKGQVKDTLVIESADDMENIDTERPISLFAQTTKDKKIFSEIQKRITQKLVAAGKPESQLTAYNSICGQVANRGPWLAKFCQTVDTFIFVGGKNSSNSKVLFEICHKHNSNSFFVTHPDELINLTENLHGRIGISGATSAPSWLIEEVAQKVKELHRA